MGLLVRGARLRGFGAGAVMEMEGMIVTSGTVLDLCGWCWRVRNASDTEHQGGFGVVER